MEKLIRLRAARLRRDESTYALCGSGVTSKVTSGEWLVTGGKKKLKRSEKMSGGLCACLHSDCHIIFNLLVEYLRSLPYELDYQPIN
jgi:hypothetical protein